MVAEPDTEVAELAPRRIIAIVAALMLGNLMAVVDTTIVAVALPTIAAEFNSLGDQSWIVTGYMLASSATVPIYGKLGDLYGRKLVYQVGIAIFLLGSVACGAAQSMSMLIAARVLQGLGAGALMVSTLSIIGEVVSPRQRGKYQAYLSMVASAGIVAGPALGGVLVDLLSWRWIFFINLPIGLTGIVVIGLVLRLHTERVEHKVDYLGSTLLVGSVVCLLLALVWGGSRHPWGSGTIIGLFAASAVLLAAFVIQEGRAPEPVLPLRIFGMRAITTSAGYMFLVSTCVFGATIIPYQQFIQVVAGAEVSEAWIYTWPFAAFNVITSITVGRLIARSGRYRRFPIMSASMLLVVMGLMSTMDESSPGPIPGFYMGLMGLGMGLGAMVPVLAAQNAVEREDLGVTTGSINFFQQLGGSVGTAVFGTIFAERLAPRLESLVASGEADAAVLAGGPDAIRELSDPEKLPIQAAYADAIQGVYHWAIPVLVVALAVALLLREAPLRQWSYAARDESGQQAAASPGEDSGEEMASSSS